MGETSIMARWLDAGHPARHRSCGALFYSDRPTFHVAVHFDVVHPEELIPVTVYIVVTEGLTNIVDPDKDRGCHV